MTQVLLSSTVTVDGITYASGDLVDFGAATAAALIAASSGAAQPAPNGRTISHASRVASFLASSDSYSGATAIRTQSMTAYTFSKNDAGHIARFTNGSAVTATVPPYSSVEFAPGTVITILQGGAGTVTIAAGGGVTINRKSGSALTTAGQYTGCQLINISTDVWTLMGSLG